MSSKTCARTIVYRREFQRRKPAEGTQAKAWWVELTDEGGFFTLTKQWIWADGHSDPPEVKTFDSPDLAIEYAVDAFLQFRELNWQEFATMAPRRPERMKAGA
jgi:hypothetical protein